MKKYLGRGDVQDLLDAIAPYKHQCKICGRKRIIKVNQDRVLCDYCGHYIYKDDNLEFRYKFQEALKK